MSFLQRLVMALVVGSAGLVVSNADLDAQSARDDSQQIQLAQRQTGGNDPNAKSRRRKTREERKRRRQNRRQRSRQQKQVAPSPRTQRRQQREIQRRRTVRQPPRAKPPVRGPQNVRPRQRTVSPRPKRIEPRVRRARERALRERQRRGQEIRRQREDRQKRRRATRPQPAKPQVVRPDRRTIDGRGRLSGEERRQRREDRKKTRAGQDRKPASAEPKRRRAIRPQPAKPQVVRPDRRTIDGRGRLTAEERRKRREDRKKKRAVQDRKPASAEPKRRRATRPQPAKPQVVRPDRRTIDGRGRLTAEERRQRREDRKKTRAGQGRKPPGVEQKRRQDQRLRKAIPNAVPPPRAGQPPDALTRDRRRRADDGDARRRDRRRARQRFRSMREIRRQRRRVETRDKRRILREPDDRMIVRRGRKLFIYRDDSRRFRRLSRDRRRGYKRRVRPNGGSVTSIRRGQWTIYSEFDRNGRLIRRYRRGRSGRDYVIIDNRRFYRRGLGIALGATAAIIALAPLATRVPARDRIIDYDHANHDDLYNTFLAPPLEVLPRRYSLVEILASPSLRLRMRRVDLGSLHFESGAWEIRKDQYPKLQRLADVLFEIIDRRSDEVFLIEGYTDTVGTEEDNISLSDRRAEAVAIALTQVFGVPAENLVTQGFGEQFLKVPVEGDEPRNRRVAVRRITPLLEQGHISNR